MPLLEKNINHENELVRSLSFKGLRVAQSRWNFESCVFKNWCDTILNRLSILNQSDLTTRENRLDLLEVVSSVAYIDLNVLHTTPEEIWIRELIVSSLFQILAPTYDMERSDFYANWLQVETIHGTTRSVSILMLIHRRVSLSLSHLDELNASLALIKDLNYEDIVGILLRNDINPWLNIQICWCTVRVMQRLSNNIIDASYINDLAEKIAIEFVDIRFIRAFFSAISLIDNLKVFEYLIRFCHVEQVRVEDIEKFQNVSARDFMRLIQARKISNCFGGVTSDKHTETLLFEVVHALLQTAAWKFEELREIANLIRALNSRNPAQNCICFFKTIFQFKLSSSLKQQVKNILESNRAFDVLLQDLNRLAVENTFSSNEILKDEHELIYELNKLNSNDPNLNEYVNNGELLSDLRRVKSLCSNSDSGKIFNWTEKDIGLWSDKVRQSSIDIVEAIAVIKRANRIVTGFHLTDTQILSSLISLKCEQTNGGRLLQVATGEGKSTIMCILAIVNGLKGRKGFSKYFNFNNKGGLMELIRK